MPKIRPAHIDDVPAISALCMAAFNEAVAPSLSAAGIATFGSVAAADAFAARLQGDNHILVAEQDARVVGVVELKEGRHLAMLFVDPACQGRGIGHALFEAVLLRVREPVLTVRASLNAVPVYERYGFVLDGEVGEFNGLVYQQMLRAAP
ncbi:GNAT family N-acetyltransferase [Stenotrophomonas maltophilia]|jgi:GNAT superfamily N-acetyltransferase|uniref:GNAT family N-acetyltransferase n=1 Tax=Stenotrophomonas TaxID=40323 RepID=UPI00062DAD02|nr:GNAT family N-acetyltransferase [Stenotrophomonas maltophilia]TIE21589.1 GNAT family N-acetyltransferase [Stenotrophomonas maltophilia]TIE66065.1 GNAT family N-acetyltransferase [Stenotrophomonas maltophilia]HEL4235924.1 GNAT family N-acetyltransferase [Stenotrophomonas maltophilia]HEL7749520.1 GNAT family N-acetyltransferase [Stenotrophomonas maltophilia]